MNKLDKYENDLLNSFENNEWQSDKNLDKRKSDLQKYAKATIRKDKRVNIRISSHDLNEIKRIAINDGLPYQTLISSVIHKYINNR